jgi:hypothetical protein
LILTLLLRLAVEDLEDGFIVPVFVGDLLADLFFDDFARPDELSSHLCEFERSCFEELLKLRAVADGSGSLESVCAGEFAVRAVMKDEAVHLDGENEDEDSSVAAADPRFVVFENRSNVGLDADADSIDVVVYALREESVEGKEVRNIEAEVVHSVGELELDSLVGNFYVGHLSGPC